MTTFIIGALLGLIVGWNFLPQPQFVKDLIAKLLKKSSE